MDGTEKFVSAGRFLSCISELKCLKYQTKTTMPAITQIIFVRFTKWFHFFEKPKALSGPKQSAVGERAPGSIGSARYAHKSAMHLAALRVYAEFTSIPRICLACLNIARSLTEKQMWHRHNSALAELDHSEGSMIGINSNSEEFLDGCFENIPIYGVFRTARRIVQLIGNYSCIYIGYNIVHHVF
jgi:hypothetical protein